jgi:prolyl-tRNA editing enzyme YbaK/EbsC (Cys-tRNA(Pro) deacylase)
MQSVLNRPAVQRVRAALDKAGVASAIHVQDETSRTAAEAAASLGISIGQIASSIIFRLPDDLPLLVITSGRHRVDTALVARELQVTDLRRADADYVKSWSGFSIGGVAPLGWSSQVSSGTSPEGYPAELTIIIDDALDDYDVVWAAAGHPYAVFPTTFAQLQLVTGARALRVGPD